ncbi:glycosyltransferase [Methylocystis bryophila]|uniref:Glycosyl transferase family 1 domain-containing protein n=2 Tax=Methylocystis bryophila TaxID=655015 RepID=A0A1W6MU27_9HYPH|nr:glycosyltransferase [Methylocystis bryophila]ARN81101.1 hypothetical protein B1812_08445 [Methylocystis bryophila]BDV37028.1 glycosyl transferase [Methylocystis bryophila]
MAISLEPKRLPPGKRAIVYDVTHLTTRLTGVTTTGIDWVDRAYARHWAGSERLACGLHYGLLAPHLLAPARVADLSMGHERKFAGADASISDLARRQLKAWLTGGGDFPIAARSRRERVVESAASLAAKTRLRIAHHRHLEIPEGALYLNVAQHGFEYPGLFRWLDARPDVAPVFLAHDLLPLDFPEYFRPGYKALFRRRFELIARRARAIVTTCDATAARLKAEFRALDRPCPPIHAEPLASPLETAGGLDHAAFRQNRLNAENVIDSKSLERDSCEKPVSTFSHRALALLDPELASFPYFVAIGTWEPRKNHILLLNVWRELVARGGEPPKLICVGGRGFGAGQMIEGLERSNILAPHVRRVHGLSSDALRQLLANARALLAPNFAEGYGIPLVEALTVGAPAVCSDIPVFREVTQNCATFLSPLDGKGWLAAVRELAESGSSANDNARRLAHSFKPPNWTEYFAGVEAFLDSL